MDKSKRDLDPTAMLQAAIKELEVFTQSEASRLEVGEDGHLVAESETRLKRIVGLARSYIGPLFSEQVRQEQEKRLYRIKQAILQARDIIQSHSALIEKFQQGNDSQRKLAEYALKAIQRYNAAVTNDSPSSTNKSDVYNYERQRLLLDEEIKDCKIELPYTVSIKYDSHPDMHPVHKTLKELSGVLLGGTVNKQYSSIISTHKKTAQFMVDTFRMKAIRMIQTHFTQQSSMSEILQLIKQTPIEINEEADPNLMMMRQLLEIGPGSMILLTGCFKRHPSDSKFMTMPTILLDSFRFSSQLTHRGFPYASQRAAWALGNEWVEAHPLRADQVPLFQQVEQRKKRLAQLLLFDQTFIHKARRNYKLKREVFDQHRDLFLSLHYELQHTLKQKFLENESDGESILKAFYQEALTVPSAYDLLAQTQQRLLDLFIRQPLKALEEEWLEIEASPLRTGSPQEKFQAASQKLEQQRRLAAQSLDPTNTQQAYILTQGSSLGRAFQSIGLQYQSEKIVFAPPLLNDSERKLQASAFHQLLDFMDECEHRLDHIDPAQIKKDLLAKWSKDLSFLKDSTIEDEHSLSISLTNELEAYFNSRFFTSHTRLGSLSM